MKPKIWLSSPHMGTKERTFVESAFDTNWISPLGPNVDGFESDLVAYLNGENTSSVHVAALNSGTAALHLALIIAGVGQGDYVLCQSFTFCGSVNPIVYLGATPVFIDSEPDTWNMSPLYLRQAIESLLKNGIKKEKLKAIIPVHLYGMPAKIDQIQAIANEFEIPIIEDAAESLGSSFKGQMCGTFGEMSILSFNGNKIITTSGGGAMVSRDEAKVAKARFLSTQARDQAPHYQHTQIGYNYRLSNVLAGIGRGQMKVIGDRITARRQNNKRYKAYFKGIPGVEFQKEPSADFFSNFWLTGIVLDADKNGGVSNHEMRLALEVENIESRPLWKPMHMQPVFEECLFFGEGYCEKLFEHGICMPSGSNLSPDDFTRIFAVLDSLFKD